VLFRSIAKDLARRDAFFFPHRVVGDELLVGECAECLAECAVVFVVVIALHLVTLLSGW